MSFSSSVKEELYENIPSGRHCQLAELAALHTLCGFLKVDENGCESLIYQIENASLVKKFFTLLEKSFNISFVLVSDTDKTHKIIIDDSEQVKKIKGALKLSLSRREMMELLTEKSCCKRAFIRGLFLAEGSISDPNSSYHLEIVCPDKERAELIKALVNSFELEEMLEAKVVERRSSYVVYLKEGSQIVDFLNIIEAHSGLLKLEETRVFKEMRNSINRQVNCEAANLIKTVDAANRQIRDIEFLRDHGGFSKLSPALLEIAQLRLEYRDIPLAELGALCDPAVGKSGVNHRLRKLSEMAEKLRY